jgi:thiol-disulfide isomerase/thioredoxin
LRTPLPSLVISLVGAALLLLAACGSGSGGTEQVPEPSPVAGDATPTAEGSAQPAELTGYTGGGVGDTAPEFTGITNWINSDPLTMEELRGKVVLIDFWTYTCVNCIRTMPYLREWQAKYADHGLVLIGMHAPEFEFEKVTENVVRAAEEFGLVYPHAQDNNFLTWRAYRNQFWPSKYMVDAQGVVRYTHSGEGGYDETEEMIRELLTEAGYDVSGIGAGDDPGPSPAPQAYGLNTEDRQSRELYGGYERNYTDRGLYIAHAEYYEATDTVATYRDPGDHINNFMYLEGPWLNGPEAIRHGRETEGFEDHIALLFIARTVNAVVDHEEGAAPYEVEVTLGGRSLTEAEAGPDVIVNGGRSYFVVDQPRMYNVVSLPTYGDGELTLSARSADFALFAFSFGAYDGIQ